MARAKNSKKGTKENPIEVGLLDTAVADLLPKRPFKIIEAQLNDMYCNYVSEKTAGVGINNKNKTTGVHVVLEDMTEAFRVFNVHLAALDSAFKIAGIEVENIDKFHVHEIVLGYRVSGFKIKGNEENESIALIGSKYSPIAQGWINIVTPFIPINGLSFYQWYNELKTATEKAREEVALYEEGKYALEDESDSNALQLTITSPEAFADNPEGNKIDAEINDDEFENARQ